MSTAIDHVNGASLDQPRYDPLALAEAEAVRERAAAEARAAEIKAKAEADALLVKAKEEAEKQRLANERQAMKLEAEKAAHEARIAKLAAEKAAADKAAAKAETEAAAEAEREAARAAEEQSSEKLWKWSARTIYGVGLIIALPLQLMAFYSDDKPFMLAAPLLLEGLALVLAFGAAWAVAHRRDVAPYRVGIMAAATIAAGINLWHGKEDPSIGIEAGIVGAIASLGGPIVLMAYEHGIAQKRDGIPSWRERRDAAKAAAKERKEAAAKAAEKAMENSKRVAEKRAAEDAAAAEQHRKDTDRQKQHPKVWEVADLMRSARGAQYVTDQIWGEAWYRVTGSKVVGITPEIETQSRAAQARMKTASEMPVFGDLLHVESQKEPRAKRDSNTVDKRRFNGGTPPRRVPGDSQPHSPIARKQASLEQTARATAEESK